MKNKRELTARAILGLYCLIMIYLLFFNGRYNYMHYTFSEYISHNTNFIPFHYIISYARNIIHGRRLFEAAVNLAGNIAVFIPLGALLPAAFQKLSSVKRFALTALCIPLMIECVQLVFMVGCFDVDDIILNVLGLGIGYGIYALLKTAGRRRE